MLAAGFCPSLALVGQMLFSVTSVTLNCYEVSYKGTLERAKVKSLQKHTAKETQISKKMLVCGCISKNGLVSIYLIRGVINSIKYVEVPLKDMFSHF